MISIIITSYREPKTIGAAIKACVNQGFNEKWELLVVCPDIETKKAVLKHAKKYKNIRHIQDLGKGKPCALNLAIKEAKGEILILTDGDVYCSNIHKLIAHFKDKKVGAVCGRVISINKKTDMLGYWSHLLTEAAHKIRTERKEKFIVCSGYLYAIRNIIKEIPEDILDDAIISQMIWEKGYKIIYEPRSIAFVKFPTNLSDWLNQKIRSAGGDAQVQKYIKRPEKMRSFSREIIFGWYKALRYPKNPKEMYWTLMLFLIRAYMWFRVLVGIKIKRKSLTELWTRVESTK